MHECLQYESRTAALAYIVNSSKGPEAADAATCTFRHKGRRLRTIRAGFFDVFSTWSCSKMRNVALFVLAKNYGCEDD